MLWTELTAALGVGGIFGAYCQAIFQHRKALKDDLHQLKRARYEAILIQMLTILYPESGLAKGQARRPDLEDLNDWKEEVRTEMLNGILFADDDVIKAMSEFVSSWTSTAFLKTVVAMRRDLWGQKTRIDEKVLLNFGRGEG